MLLTMARNRYVMKGGCLERAHRLSVHLTLPRFWKGGRSWTLIGIETLAPRSAELQDIAAIAAGRYDSKSGPSVETLQASITTSCPGTAGQRLSEKVSRPGGRESERTSEPDSPTPPPPVGALNLSS